MSPSQYISYPLSFIRKVNITISIKLSYLSRRTESWAGPGNEARVCTMQVGYCHGNGDRVIVFPFDAHLPREAEMFARGIVRPVPFLRKAARHRGFVVVTEREYSEVSAPGCLCLVPS